MKKLTVLTVLMTLMALGMTSCQKEGTTKASDLTFVATTEGGAKTHLAPDGFGLRWDSGDGIMISDGAVSATFTATSITGDGSSATFTTTDDVTLASGRYCSYYPASIYNEDGTVALPAIQHYAPANNVGAIIIIHSSLGGSNIDGFPMYAESRDCNLHFKNLCGVMRLNLQQTDISIREIRITTNRNIWGDLELSQTDDARAISAGEVNGNNNTVTLDCGENGVDISTAKDFNIYLPVGSYSTFNIEIVSTDGGVCTKSLTAEQFTINRNEVYTLTCSDISFVDPHPPLPTNAIYITVDGAPFHYEEYVAQCRVLSTGEHWFFAAGPVGVGNLDASDYPTLYFDFVYTGTGYAPSFIYYLESFRNVYNTTNDDDRLVITSIDPTTHTVSLTYSARVHRSGGGYKDIEITFSNVAYTPMASSISSIYR